MRNLNHARQGGGEMARFGPVTEFRGNGDMVHAECQKDIQLATAHLTIEDLKQLSECGP